MAKAVEEPISAALWMDDFTQLDTRTSGQHFADHSTPTPPTEEGDPVSEDGEDPEVDGDETEDIEVGPEAKPAAQPAPAPVPEDESEHIEYADGATLDIEKTARGWKATCVAGKNVTPEVFYGKTKNEMFLNVAAGKINATQKIRQLNKQLRTAAEPPAAPQQPEIPAPRKLTADEVFKFKTQLQSDPDLAFDEYFMAKTGMSVEQLVSLAREGKTAKDELTAESVVRDFLAAEPDYYGSDKNFFKMTEYLSEKYLGRAVVKPTKDGGKDMEKALAALYFGNFWTVAKLQAAYADLSDDGLLELAPVEEEPEEDETVDAEEPEQEEEEIPEPVRAPRKAPAPVAPAQNERIVRSVRRPRAGLGISARSSSPPKDPTPPTVEDLNDLSLAEINKLLAESTKVYQRQRRR